MGPRILLLLLTLLLLGTVTSASLAAKNQPTSVMALNVFDLKLHVDSTMDIGGETRFFTSRPNRYVGGRFMVHTGQKSEAFFSRGTYTGFCWGKSRYNLNWEEPGLASFEPLDTSIGTLAWPLGMDFNFRLGKFMTISPHVGARMMLLRMSLEIGNEDFSGNSFKLGLDAGVKIVLRLGSFNLAGGASLTHILNEEIEFDVDDLTFDSKTTGSSPEYFLGVEL